MWAKELWDCHARIFQPIIFERNFCLVVWDGRIGRFPDRGCHLFSMGCDGGSIPSRRELVRQRPKDTSRKDAEDQSRTNIWRFCRISNDPLRMPVVICSKGWLYNKESVIKHILSKAVLAKFDHFKSLKDVKTLNLTCNPNFVNDRGLAPFQCPVTGKEMNGQTGRFFYMRDCGCVVSEAAIRQLKDSKECLKCGKPSSKPVEINGPASACEAKKRPTNEEDTRPQKFLAAPVSFESSTERVLALTKTRAVASLYKSKE